MRKNATYVLLLICLFYLCSFNIHKFYVSITQLEYVERKKSIQITSRIFTDDLIKALEQKSKSKIYLGTSKEKPEEKTLLQNYLSEKVLLKINGVPKKMVFLAAEVENDVILSYWVVKDVSKVNRIEIQNTCLMEWFPEQQNIIHTNLYGKKQSLLLTSENYIGTIKI